MADKLRCAIVGAGALGLEYLQSLAACPRAAAVAVSENHPQRAREAGERFHIPRVYSDYHELIDQPDIDAVLVALPNHLHAAVAVEALNARKHVLVAPPLAHQAKDAVRVVEAARRMRRTLMVAHALRFHRHTQAAKTHLERGDAGDVYHAHAFWLRRTGIPRIGSWYTQKQFSGGGCGMDLGAHLLDVTLHLMKEFEVASVSARCHARFGTRGLGECDSGKSEIDPRRPYDVEDYCLALLQLKSGRTVALETSWAAHHSPQAREYGVDLVGTNAGVSLYPAQLIRNVPDGLEVVYLNTHRSPYSENPVHHFVACALEGKRPLAAPEEALKIQQILEAIYESAASKREVKLR